MIDRLNPKPLVVIESPYAPTSQIERTRNDEYAHAALLDSIDRGEAPFAGHLLYTQVLDDFNPEQRALGIALHVEFLCRADLIAVYHDLDISPGMTHAIDIAKKLAKPIQYRLIRG